VSIQAPATEAAAPAKRRLAFTGIALAIGFTLVLAGAWLSGNWLFDDYGRPIANDFVDVYAAGELALDGNAEGAYDWSLHKAVEVDAVGYDFENYYGWHYPPTYFFVAAPLALLSYSAAALIFLGITLVGYAAAIWRILGSRAGILVALGSPAALWNATAGQNGYLTAALIGGTLGFMDRQPVLAGICLGLLSFKPHLGILFPLALIAGARWLTFMVAALVTAGWAALSFFVFGSDSWQSFIEWIPKTSHVVFGEGAAGFNRLQSLFGLVRAFGGSEPIAWGVQIVAAVALAIAIIWLWHSRAAFELKAAGLSCAALLATPYIYMYDLVALTVPVAFLLKLALNRGFFALEVAGLGAAVVLLLIFPYAQTQVGLAATVIVAALIIHRLSLSMRPAPSMAPT